MRLCIHENWVLNDGKTPFLTWTNSNKKLRVSPLFPSPSAKIARLSKEIIIDGLSEALAMFELTSPINCSTVSTSHIHDHAENKNSAQDSLISPSLSSVTGLQIKSIVRKYSVTQRWFAVSRSTYYWTIYSKSIWPNHSSRQQCAHRQIATISYIFTSHVQLARNNQRTIRITTKIIRIHCFKSWNWTCIHSLYHQESFPRQTFWREQKPKR